MRPSNGRSCFSRRTRSTVQLFSDTSELRVCAQQAKHTNARADRSADIGHSIPFIIGRLLHMFFSRTSRSRSLVSWRLSAGLPLLLSRLVLSSSLRVFQLCVLWVCARPFLCCTPRSQCPDFEIIKNIRGDDGELLARAVAVLKSRMNEVMKSRVNPPTPWPNWQAPVSTRKLADHHGARGGGCLRAKEPGAHATCPEGGGKRPNERVVG